MKIRRKRGDTKAKILAAASKLFFTKGLDATSTTDIAREAGCNHALIHYYFRNKENLVRKVFNNNFLELHKVVDAFVFTDDADFMTIIRRYIDLIFSTLESTENLADFLVKELLLNASRREQLVELFMRNEHRTQVFAKFSEVVSKAEEAGQIRKVSPADLLVDIMSLAVMSFAAMPLYVKDYNPETIDRHEVLESRKREIYELVTVGLQPCAEK